MALVASGSFGGRTPQQLITEGRMRDLVIEFDRLRERQPRLIITAKQRGAIESWIGTAASVEDTFFRSVERR